MDKRVMDAVLVAYEKKREKNSLEEARRLREISAKFPYLSQLLEKRHRMVMDSVRSAFAGKDAPDAEERMAQYNREIRALLKEKGFPEDYLSPVCECEKCRDSGYIYENGHKRPCECLEKACLRALSGAEETQGASGTFEAFDETVFPEAPLPGTDVTQREYMRIVRDRCLLYASQLPLGPLKTLLLHGGSGLGKTYLLQCVGNEAMKRGMQVASVSAYDLLMALKNAYFSRTGEGAEEYLEAELLLIDDLGMEPLIENVTVEQIYYLLNTRLNKGLYTAITTNLSRTEIQQRYTERVSSRLLNTRTGLAIPFRGRDIRLLKD